MQSFTPHVEQEVKATNRQLVPVIYARIISAAAAHSPQAMREILAGTGLAERTDKPVQLGMTLAEYRQLLANAQRISGDPAIALRAGINLPFTVHGAQGIAVAASATLRVAIDTLVNYGRLRNPFSKILLREEGDKAIVRFDLDKSLGDQTDAALDFMLAAVASAIVNLASIPLSYCCITFTRPPPANLQTYTSLLPAELKFGGRENSIAFLQAELQQALPGANPDEFRAALERCENTYANVFRGSTVAAKTQTAFARSLGHICTLDEVADQLNMSSRTLQRRLKQEGHSFQQLLDQWLGQQALQYLRDERLSVEVAAVLLGYTDQANFRRAFKRWFGLPPRQYLQRDMDAAN
jgi:AraC-like DNA-binding protein